ncbi:MAG: sulfurtransferase TusA family protein [Spirochaetales bacterium]|nr:sulfurtransferase TusA family protein [Spirochaetales bacterium]
MKKIDCRGLSCPEPVIMTKRALKEDSEVAVTVDSRVPMENISRFARALGIEPVIVESDGEWTLTLKK